MESRPHRPGLDPTTAITLVWAALIVTALGLLTTSREPKVLGPAVGALLAAVPAIFARGRVQRVAGLICAGTLGLAASAVPWGAR